ncbi:hypothetical protein OE88DRAFT_902129 [Heliocybe sulcata]|uniref:Uncharacterized protein n=1 Tax=Heliocybe sulcata TaxID=5364 RepID=A0A5C3MYH6_9AGAM|nr:hypothetical protein OE88DRAFT_902129 [Heliocybe sulcata]
MPALVQYESSMAVTAIRIYSVAVGPRSCSDDLKNNESVSTDADIRHPLAPSPVVGHIGRYLRSIRTSSSPFKSTATLRGACIPSALPILEMATTACRLSIYQSRLDFLQNRWVYILCLMLQECGRMSLM